MREFTDTLITQDDVSVMQNPKILDFNSRYFIATKSDNEVLITNAERVAYLETRIKRPALTFGIGTYYFAVNGREDVAIANARSYLPACTLKELYVSSICSANSGTVTITILKNGVATDLVKALSVSTAYARDSNLSDSISLVYGDYVTIQMDVVGSSIQVLKTNVRLGMVL